MYFIDSHLLESMFLAVRKSEPAACSKDKQLGDDHQRPQSPSNSDNREKARPWRNKLEIL